jgi:uncharacterized membrane-anchored protein
VQQVAELAERYNVKPPARDARHFSADLGPFRLKWERHAEFARYKFIVSGPTADPFAHPAIKSVPQDWLAALPGQLIMAAHAALLAAGSEPPNYENLAARYFGGNGLVGSAVADGAATALTDFHIHADGFSRFLVLDRSLTLHQAGRTMQRLVEIETYRLLALLALPIAQASAPVLGRDEDELARVTAALVGTDDQSEPALLDRLTRLEAEIESRQAQNHFRFGAAIAYYDLVQRRIAELREVRLPGIQTFRDFTERRLAPAMSTCRGIAQRQEMLSARVARATQLLSTRVDLTRERQELALLQSMNRRADLQLRLQQTVEGLSVAAITYYIVGLVGYAAKALKALGLVVNAELVMGLSIPLVASIVALGLRRIHRTMRRRSS